LSISILMLDQQSELKNSLEKRFQKANNHYEILFTSSEDEVPIILENENIDILICEMSMLKNGGVQFFEDINQKHPDIIRFLFIEDDEQDLALKSMLHINHFIKKPVDANIICRFIDRIVNVRTVLGSEKLLLLSTRVNNLPSLPEVFFQLMEELQTECPSVPKISKLIEHDSSIASRIIQIVNSPAVGLSHRINNIEQAISLLGLIMTKTLVMYAGVNSYLHTPVHILATAESINNHSFTIGNLAEAISMAETGSYALSQEAKMAGILNNIGYLLLLNNPETQINIKNILYAEKQTLFEAERMHTSITHGEIGAYFLGIRGFNESLLEAIAYYYRPNVRPASGFNTLTSLHIANALTPSPLKSIIPCKKLQLDYHYIEKLGLIDRIETWQAIAQDIVTADTQG